MLNDDDLQAIEERAVWTTPGPWCGEEEEVRSKNLEFVATYRDDVLKLVAEIGRLKSLTGLVCCGNELVVINELYMCPTCHRSGGR